MNQKPQSSDWGFWFSSSDTRPSWGREAITRSASLPGASSLRQPGSSTTFKPEDQHADGTVSSTAVSRHGLRERKVIFVDRAAIRPDVIARTSAPPARREAGELSALRELVEWAPCGYLTWGDDGVITWLNQTFPRWTGRQRDALVGTRQADLLPVEDRVLWATSCVPQLRTTGSVAEVVPVILTAAGSRRAVLITATRYDAVVSAAPQVKVVVFGVHERGRQQWSLMDALYRAWESDQRRASAEA